MAQERKDLLAIGDLLNISTKTKDSDWSNNKTDIELLRLIVDRLDYLKKQGDESNLGKLVNNIPDSMAFPNGNETTTTNKQQLNLAERNDFWNALDKFNDLLKQDYSCRRQMLLNRLDCTVESFKWKSSSSEVNKKEKNSTESKSLNDKIHELYDPIRIDLSQESNVSISHLLAARETDCDKLLNSVISAKSVDCKVAYKNENHRSQHRNAPNKTNDNLVNLKQIIIPDVPDRGGRPGEIRPPNRESFSQQRKFQRGGRRH